MEKRGFSGTYVTANVEPFRRVARACRQIEFDDVLEESCMLPSGECNLTMIYVLINAGRPSGQVVDIIKKIDEVLADEYIRGDARMTWWLAKAYAKEVGISPVVRPGRGLVELREAFASAESDEYRFWALQEIVARLVAVGKNDEVQSLVDSLKNQFSESEKQESMTQWLILSEGLTQSYQERQQQSRNTSFARLSTELNRRSDQMMKSGNTDAARELKGRASDIAKPTNP